MPRSTQNTAATGTGLTEAQSAAITANTAKVSITNAQSSAITTNTAKSALTNAQSAAITTNTAKVGITNVQSSAIVANTSAASIVIPRITHLINFPGWTPIQTLLPASDIHSGLNFAAGFPVATLNSGFKAGSDNGDLVYEVQMRGCFGCVGVNHAAILFILPASYRPSQSVRVSVSKGGSGPASLAILVNGNVQYINASGANTSHIFLDGVRYYTK